MNSNALLHHCVGKLHRRDIYSRIKFVQTIVCAVSSECALKQNCVSNTFPLRKQGKLTKFWAGMLTTEQK